MNSFFGTIQIHPDPGTAEVHHSAFQLLEKKFPSRFGNRKVIHDGPLSITGDFECSVVKNHSSLYFCGELYNRSELESLAGQDHTFADNQAGLLHRLILQNGLSSVPYCNGRFLILYYNQKKNELHLMNDQMGIQQVLYHQKKDYLLFASEIKFLMAHSSCPRTIDWALALLKPIPFEVLNGERQYNAWFKDIKLLPEAGDACLDLHEKTCRIKSYWDPFSASSRFAGPNYSSETQIMEAYMDLLEDAVKIRMQDASVAYSLLSGGLDSSVICAMARRYKPVQCYSIITQATLLEGTTELCHNLSQDLDLQNIQFPIPFHKLAFDPVLWKKRVWQSESPVSHTDFFTKSILHAAIRKTHPEAGYTLSGTGSDQLNGGLVRWVVRDSDTEDESWAHFHQILQDEECKTMMRRNQETLWCSRSYIKREVLGAMSGLAAEQNDWLYYIKSNLHINQFSLLWDENRASAANQHSSRYPFLDYRFPAFVAGIPKHFHSNLFFDKRILRTPSSRFLPDYITQKSKAPVHLGRYDFFPKLYESILCENEMAMIIEAFGDLESDHPFLDLKSLVAGVEQLKENPDPKAWQYILNIVNLGLMEQLADQDETSMDLEAGLEPITGVFFDTAELTLAKLREKLDIESDDSLLRKSILFQEDCGMASDTIRNKTYVYHNNLISYELDPDQKSWKSFLEQVGSGKSPREIMVENHIEYDSIREYIHTLVKEGILIFKD